MEVGARNEVISAGARGFGYIEMMISMVILVVGLGGVLGLLGYTLATLTFAQDDLTAKQKAREAMESIFTARNTQQIVFDDIRNVSGGGIFLDGFQPLLRPNPEGLVGTATDGDPEFLQLPGPDDILGTDDDEFRSLDRFERRIEIAGVPGSGDIRELTVTVRYRTLRGTNRVYRVQAYVSRFR